MKSFFEAHIWPLRSRLYRLVYLWVRDRSLAEDLLQNVFERSFQRQDQLEKHPNLNGWLVRSLKNEALMHFRKESKITGLEELDDLPIEGKPENATAEKLEKVYVMLKSLPEKQLEVFQLREMEGLTYEEIAEYLKISLEQVKVNLFRARQAIRNQLIKPN
ncbi:RNA polymerase sigma factor [Algoriphagus sp.]|uniref:RNA polymerase sigma factor n=1 Tax=Algoriphagus sp. TaxID=1872435 RepID=UPI0026201200|nr:RNA polymerase sigma factor [Algoriphagus sp.]